MLFSRLREVHNSQSQLCVPASLVARHLSLSEPNLDKERSTTTLFHLSLYRRCSLTFFKNMSANKAVTPIAEGIGNVVVAARSRGIVGTS